MQSRHWAGLIVLSLASATPALATGQADAKGFVEDSALNVLLRNAYINRDYSDGRQDSSEWGQGIIANFSSGFTQGTVGFGVDAFAAYGLRLDSTRRRSGNGGIDFFIQDSNGNPGTMRSPRAALRSRRACPTPCSPTATCVPRCRCSTTTTRACCRRATPAPC